MSAFRLAVAAGVMASVLAAGASAAALTETKSPLVGTWRTTIISQADAEVTLRRHGLSKWIPPFRRQTPFTEPMSLILVITPREWDLYGKPKGNPRVEIDYDAEYVVKGSSLPVCAVHDAQLLAGGLKRARATKNARGRGRQLPRRDAHPVDADAPGSGGVAERLPRGVHLTLRHVMLLDVVRWASPMRET